MVSITFITFSFILKLYFKTPLKAKRLKLIQKHMLPSVTNTSRSDLNMEFDQYLSKSYRWNEDVQTFWNINSNIFPLLSKLAQALLSVSPTSAISGIVVSKQTSSIDPERVRRKIFVHDNYKVLLK